VSTSRKNPASLAASRAPNSFCVAAEQAEPSRTASHVQEEILEIRAALLTDFVFGALAPVVDDAEAARLCLKHDDDAGAQYHLKRVVECVKAAASTFREPEGMTRRAG
jgi:hypothetical protein